MKTIKIIDLLNKIANGEELPNRIKHCGAGYKHIYFDLYKSHDYEDTLSGDLLFADRIIIQEHLNDEVEILDEEDEFEDIEEIPIKLVEETSHYELKEKLNQLIKNQKKNSLEKKMLNLMLEILFIMKFLVKEKL